jgi:hypothetical protein
MRTNSNGKMIENTNKRVETIIKTQDYLPSVLRASNLGSLAEVFWPFFFVTQPVIVIPGAVQNTSITITQEAGFIWKKTSICCFLREDTTGSFSYSYINRDAADYNAAHMTGLTWMLRDTSSSREFSNLPEPCDTLGNADFPEVLPTPVMLRPNGTYEIIFQNNHPTRVYMPQITFFGYRLRSGGLATLHKALGG